LLALDPSQRRLGAEIFTNTKEIPKSNTKNFEAMNSIQEEFKDATPQVTLKNNNYASNP